MFGFTKQQIAVLLLAGVVVLGSVLRAYHFSDWLHFELDQARDARVVDDGLGGDVFDLPLLGPRGGGTYFRLAPGFYYLEYVGALLFGSDPAGQATIVMLLSILTIPLFYFFVKRFFGTALSLGLTTLFSVSAFLVVYGRFAWNPNPLPFFLLLGAYALLRSVDHSEVRRGRWFLLSVSAFVFSTHLHSLILVGAPLIAGGFLLLKRPKFSWKVWLAAGGIVGVLYAPFLFNEWETGGRNSQEFFRALSDKTGESEHSLFDKSVKNTFEQALGFGLLLSGSERSELPKVTVHPFLVACDEECDRRKPAGIAWLVLYGLGSVAFLFRLIREPGGSRRDFLWLTGMWFVVMWLLLLPIAYDYAPRFLLLIAPLPFVFMGVFLEALLRRFHYRQFMKGIVFSVVLLLCAANLYFLSVRFSEWSRAHTEPVKHMSPDRILKDKARVTLEQQSLLVDHMQAEHLRTGYPVYMFSEPQHRRALKYLLERRGVPNAVLGYDGLYRQGVYFLILRSRSDLEDGMRKYLVNYTVKETKSFGTLTLIQFVPTSGLDISEKQDFSLPKADSGDFGDSPRYTWRQVWERRAALPDDGEEVLE